MSDCCDCVNSRLTSPSSSPSHSNDQSSKVKNYMLEILSSLMQEGESLSQEIIDIVLLNVVEPAKVLAENQEFTTSLDGVAILCSVVMSS